MIMIIISCIVFLNFIVAEAGNTYNEVSEQLENVIQQQKASLIDEVESLLPNPMWSKEKFPKYIIVREIQT